MTFNKRIWEDSFDINDLNVSAGTISKLTKINDSTWEIRIADIPKGQTAELTLKEGSVLDYSAVVSVKVLGENKIRFATEEGVAAGKLPETGSSSWLLTFYALLFSASGLFLTSKNNLIVRTFNTVKVVTK